VVRFHPIIRNDHPLVWRNRALQAEKRVREAETRSLPTLTSDRAYEILVGGASSSGANVNTHTALTISAVTACVGLIADMVALLPCQLVRKTERGDVPVMDHPAARVMDRPGDLHTSYEMRQLCQVGAGLGGNGYMRVHRDGAGNPAELEWLSPLDVMPQRLTGQRFVTYRVANERALLTRYDIAHVRALSTDGVMGRSPVTLLRQSIGTSIAQSEAAGTMMKNGSRFNGVIEAPHAAQPKQLEDIRREWASRHEGSANAGKTPVLWGATFKQVGGMSAVDAQFIESRRFELQEIARLYRIPPVLIGDPASSTLASGIEQMNLALLAYCLNPWLVNWEQSLNYTLLTTDELRAGLRFKFDREEIQAVALQAQASFLSTMRTTGIFSPNDSREWLGYPKSDAPGMDDARAPLNSSSTGSIQNGDTPAAATPTEDGAPLADSAEAAAAGDVQATALNGAQIQALAGIIKQVADGELPLDSAKALAASAFPLIPAEEIEKIFAPLANFTPAQPAESVSP
jgi:HK97 family phage portal protein